VRIVIFWLIIGLVLMANPWPVFAGPVSSNYELLDYSVGNSGGKEDSSNYTQLGTTETLSGDESTSSNYKIGANMIYTVPINVPLAPSFTNPASYYNQLKIVIDNSTNTASDVEYLIAISPDSFATTTNYVQSDHTISSGQVWQTYTNWNGVSGFNIVGLSPGVTYTVKVKARQGDFTETDYSPTAAAATSNPSLTFDIDVAPSDQSTSPPYLINFTLDPGVVATAADKTWATLDTNATNGGAIFVSDTNGGLISNNTGGTVITSSTADLSSSNGYGIQGSTIAEVSGGPMEILSPYNGASNNVGVLDTSTRAVFDSSNSPVTSGRVSFSIKAKAGSTSPASNDYSDVLTVLASANY
jgi:hypothetical protein